MSDLQLHVTTLRRFFEPWATEPGGPAIWEPDESDENADLKRQVAAKARQILLAGETALSGVTPVELPALDKDFCETVQALEKDHELDKFLALITACKNVAHCIPNVRPQEKMS